MRMLFFTHSGLRYLVLAAALVALLYYGYALATRKGTERASRVVGSVFVGVLDLQIVLGLLMVVLGFYYPMLIGHIVLMLLAAAVAHAALVIARRTPDPARAYAFRFSGVLVSLLLVVAGIMAIGRSVLGTGVPTPVS